MSNAINMNGVARYVIITVSSWSKEGPFYAVSKRRSAAAVVLEARTG
jgi:hypothetical protein